MNKLIIIALMCLGLTGCSFLPRFTFDRPGATPTQTQKSQKNEKCAGEFKLDQSGNIISCSKGYSNVEQNYSQKDRTYTWQEKAANFVRNLTGWGFPLLLAGIVFIPGFGGALLGFVLQNILSIPTKGFRMLVTGIQKGKNYVRENGSKYNEAERKIYIQGAEDMLAKISENVTDKKVAKEINLLRAELK